MTAHATRIRRSLLFTPANRTSAFAKALESGADCVAIDLEDAVPPAEKPGARNGAVAFLCEGAQGPERVLRINALSTRFGLDDLSAVAGAAPTSGAILLPKTSSGAELRLVLSVLDGVGARLEVAALIESAEGLRNVDEIARAVPPGGFLLFGAIDLSADLGCALDSDTMQHAASRVVHAARAAGVDVLDVPELGFRDLDRVGQAARTARDRGFSGKAAIHPSNVAAINTSFTPSADEILEARRIVEAFEASPNGLAVLDGRLVEAPVVRAMRRRLAIAAAVGV